MPTLPFAAMLARTARTAPDAPALVDRAQVVTAGELHARALGCAAWLVAEGVRAGETIGVAVAGEYANLVTSLALVHLGVAQVSLPARDPLPLRAELARQTAVARVVADGDAAALPGSTVARLLHPRGAEPADVATIEPLAPDPDAPALFATSSGTTGRPKLFALSQRLMALRADELGASQRFGPGQRIVLPMSSQSYPGKTVRLYALARGMATVLHDGASSGPAMVDAVLRAGASMLQLTVLQARGLVADGEGARRLPPATAVFLGASRMPAGLPRAFEARVGGRLYNRYGTSEVGMIANAFPLGEDDVPDSVGRIVAGAEVEVLDADGRALPPGHAGELRFRTPWMVSRYHDDDGATAMHFRDGWFHPRDVGLVTTDGTLRFLGRRDDMMSLNGINIFPAEIERALESHPGVKHAAAFPIASAVHGEIPAAAVEPQPGANLDPRELERHARARLGERAPRRVIVVDELPRNAAGKVLKHELAAGLAGERGDG